MGFREMDFQFEFIKHLKRNAFKTTLPVKKKKIMAAEKQRVNLLSLKEKEISNNRTMKKHWRNDRFAWPPRNCTVHLGNV